MEINISRMIWRPYTQWYTHIYYKYNYSDVIWGTWCLTSPATITVTSALKTDPCSPTTLHNTWRMDCFLDLLWIPNIVLFQYKYQLFFGVGHHYENKSREPCYLHKWPRGDKITYIHCGSPHLSKQVCFIVWIIWRLKSLSAHVELYGIIGSDNDLSPISAPVPLSKPLLGYFWLDPPLGKTLQLNLSQI